MAYNEDGYKWEALKKDASFLTTEAGKDKLMRDPCIIKGGDGLYHLAYSLLFYIFGAAHLQCQPLKKEYFVPQD